MAANPQQQLQQLIQQVADLQNQMQNMQLQMQARPAQRPKPSLPDPVKFDGKSYHFDTWLPSIQAKLRVDGGAIGDDVAQFYYVYDRLESVVQSQVLPQLARAEEDQQWRFQTILDQLNRAHDNPNRTQDALDRLHRIEQKPSESLASYITNFDRLLFEAKGHNWDDDRKISAFRYGLISTIKNRLAQQLELPRTWDNFLIVVHKLSAASSSSSRPGFSSAVAGAPAFHSNRPSAQPAADTMDLTVMNREDLELYEINQPAMPALHTFEPTSRTSYRETGACLRCGSFDHWLADCPQPARPSAATKSAGSSGKQVTITAPYASDSESETYSSYGRMM